MQTSFAKNSVSRGVDRSLRPTGCSRETTRSNEASARLRPIRGTDGTVPAVRRRHGPYLLSFPQSTAAADRNTLVSRPKMETEQSKSGDPVAAPSHIIERPRLIKLMEDSGARVIVLQAPAGYGKTTLARQWAATGGRTATWYRCTPASADIAVLALHLAASLAEVVPGAGKEMQQRLRAGRNPGSDVDQFVELLAERLVSWPAAAWLIIDDHHFLGLGTAAEAFVEGIVLETPVRVLSTSRMRPQWASNKRILYGEVLDLDQRLLAFTQREARKVLGDRDIPLAARAQGWPAVVGLASRLPDSVIPRKELPEELFGFLAEELFQDATQALQGVLLRLALCPSFDVRMVSVALDGDEPAAALLECADRGFLHRTRDGDLEMHPLLRSFLQEKIKRSQDSQLLALPEQIALYFLDRRAWDETFALQLSFPTGSTILLLLERAVDDMLDAGRLETVVRWLDFAKERALQHPIVDLSAAKVAFRQADHARAEVLAASAADMFDTDNPAHAVALITAGQAAMLGDRTLEARNFFGRARNTASRTRELREAQMGDFFASLELEHSDASQILAELEAGSPVDPRTKLRLATAQLLISATVGSMESAAELAGPLSHLVETVEDPYTTSSFLCALAATQALSAHYREALATAERALDIAQELGLDFAVPHAKTFIAVALTGQRKYASASAVLNDVERRAQDSGNAYAVANAGAFRARLLLMQGGGRRVLDLVPAETPTTPPGLVEEQRMIRALALACEGALEEALSASEIVRSKRSEGTTLKACTRAIVHLQEPSLTDETPEDAYALVAATGNFDSLVCAYRGFPELLRQLSESHHIRPDLLALLSRANDGALASRVGLAPPPQLRKAAVLSSREREVLGLLCEGLTNRQIAGALFISPATVKVHLRHVYEKLGVQNRTQAILSARGT